MSPERLSCDLLITGAGPAGSVCAAAAARAGLDVLLVDKAVFPRDKLCGDFLTPGSVRFLEEHGLGSAASRLRPVPLTGSRLVYRGREIPMPFPGGRPGWALGRRDLDHALVAAARAAGARVVEGLRVENLTDEGPEVLARGSGPRTGPVEITAAFAVDAGGRNALLPRRKGWRIKARWPVKFALGAWFDGVRGLGDRVEMHVLQEGYVGISPLGARLAGAAAVVPASLLSAWKHETDALLARLIRSSPELRRRFEGARPVSATRGAGPLAHGASRTAAGRIAMAGDAVSFVDPFTGEGVLAALRSGERAARLAVETLRPAAEEDPAASYERDIGRMLAPRHAMARGIQVVLAAPPLARRVAAALSRRPDLASAIIRVTGGLAEPASLLRLSFSGSLLGEILLAGEPSVSGAPRPSPLS